MIAVAEQFFSIQGEGYWVGTPAWFIRLQGCSIGCPWCDSKDTWNIVKPNMRIQDVIDGVPAHIKHVVITGGEPFEQNIQPLLRGISDNRHMVQIETSGCFDTYGPQWVTVSPKFIKPLSIQAIENASEIKQVVTCERDIERLMDEVLVHCSAYLPVYLQPVSNGSKALKICIDACEKTNFRLSVQTHKFLGLR